MFQIAAHPFIEGMTEHCEGGLFHPEHSITYNRLQTSPYLEATTSTTTVAQKYPNDG